MKSSPNRWATNTVCLNLQEEPERIMAVTEAEVGQPETAEWSSCRWTSDLKRCISRAVGRDLPSSQEILSLIHSSSYK